MHLKTDLPYHKIITKVKIDVTGYNWKTGKKEVRNEICTFPNSYQGKKNNLQNVLSRNAIEIKKDTNLAVDPKQGTIGGIPVRVNYLCYPSHIPTHSEISCHKNHQSWRCEMLKGKKVSLQLV